LNILPHCEWINVTWGTIILLAAFALLNLIGITESAVTALVIFVVHLLTLLVLVGFCLAFAIEVKKHKNHL
jgi:amino acid transporter